MEAGKTYLDKLVVLMEQKDWVAVQPEGLEKIRRTPFDEGIDFSGLEGRSSLIFSIALTEKDGIFLTGYNLKSKFKKEEGYAKGDTPEKAIVALMEDMIPKLNNYKNGTYIVPEMKEVREAYLTVERE